jgi:cation diffusion facilitator family transporter
MKDCCNIHGDVPERQRRTLQIVLWINAAMFIAEFAAGLVGHSTALLADSVDMLGDAIVYGFSLYVISRGPVWQARAALLKGIIMAIFGVGVLTEAVVKMVRGAMPSAELMGGIGLAALAANSACLMLLWRHRAEDINMRSAWLCSRNDVVVNVGVLVAAGGVVAMTSPWPDIVIGLIIAGMFGSSALGIIRTAWRDLRPPTASIETTEGAALRPHHHGTPR